MFPSQLPPPPQLKALPQQDHEKTLFWRAMSRVSYRGVARRAARAAHAAPRARRCALGEACILRTAQRGPPALCLRPPPGGQAAVADGRRAAGVRRRRHRRGRLGAREGRSAPRVLCRPSQHRGGHRASLAASRAGAGAKGRAPRRLEARPRRRLRRPCNPQVAEFVVSKLQIKQEDDVRGRAGRSPWEGAARGAHRPPASPAPLLVARPLRLRRGRGQHRVTQETTLLSSKQRPHQPRAPPPTTRTPNRTFDDDAHRRPRPCQPLVVLCPPVSGATLSSCRAGRRSPRAARRAAGDVCLCGALPRRSPRSCPLCTPAGVLRWRASPQPRAARRVRAWSPAMAAAHKAAAGRPGCTTRAL
jgi:hypothetical protein